MDEPRRRSKSARARRDHLRGLQVFERAGNFIAPARENGTAVYPAVCAITSATRPATHHGGGADADRWASLRMGLAPLRQRELAVAAWP